MLFKIRRLQVYLATKYDNKTFHETPRGSFIVITLLLWYLKWINTLLSVCLFHCECLGSPEGSRQKVVGYENGPGRHTQPNHQ